MTDDDQSRPERVPVNDPQELTWKLYNLDPDTRYLVNIAATTSAGAGVKFPLEDSTRPAAGMYRPLSSSIYVFYFLIGSFPGCNFALFFTLCFEDTTNIVLFCSSSYLTL